MQSQEPSNLSLEIVHPGDAEVDIEVLSAVPKEFCIDSKDSANWAVRKILAARAYAEQVKVWAEEEHRRAAREEHTLMFLFVRQIEAWVRGELALLKGKRKSINLPAGIVGFRSVGPRLVIDDEALVLAWAKVHLPEAVIVTEKLSKSAINEHAEKDGVIPDAGVYIEPAAEKFFIR